MAYLVYWHKMANSGVYGSERAYNKATAEAIADDLAKQPNVFTVWIIRGKVVKKVKG